MMAPLVSVIIPIYNIEKYLNKCVQSVLEQEYIRIEIVLVDDGSTDGCSDICDALALRDKRIKVFHKKNGGLSDARNYGLDHSSGQFIVFIDGDDYVHCKMISCLVETQRRLDTDITVCAYKRVLEDEVTDSNAALKADEISCEIFEKGEIIKQLWLKDGETIVQWNKLYRRELFENIRYPEGKYHEDIYVIHKLLWNSKRIAYISAVLYYYVQRKGSIMDTESRRMILDAIEGYESRRLFFGENKMFIEKERTTHDILRYIIWKYFSREEGEKSEWLYFLYKEKYLLYRPYKKKLYEKIFNISPEIYVKYRKLLDVLGSEKNKIKKNVKKLVKYNEEC